MAHIRLVLVHMRVMDASVFPSRLALKPDLAVRRSICSCILAPQSSSSICKASHIDDLLTDSRLVSQDPLQSTSQPST